MSELINVIKRGGQRPSESFDRDKLHGSVRAACLSVRSPEGEADLTATTVCNIVARWCNTKPEVTSSDLRRKAADALHILHPEAAYLYKQHRLVI
jgi:transcriptional regulator NrdR family protein